jgi:hypothetical protein
MASLPLATRSTSLLTFCHINYHLPRLLHCLPNHMLISSILYDFMKLRGSSI